MSGDSHNGGSVREDAAAGDRLSHGRLSDPAWLVTADPEQVLVALDGAAGPEEASGAAVYRASGHAHRDAGAGVRQQILALDAARYGQPELSRSIAEVPVHRDADDSWAARWTVRWATGSGLDSRLRYALPAPSTVTVVAAVVAAGRGFAVAGCEDGTLHWWDLATGRRLGQVTGHSRAVCALVTAVSDGRALAVTSGFMGEVRVWDLTGGKQVGELRVPGDSFVKSLATGLVEGCPVVVAASTDNVLRVWDLHTLIRDGEPSTAAPVTIQTGFVSALATTVLDGRPLVVTSHSRKPRPTDPVTGDESLRFWDLATGREVGPGSSDPMPATGRDGQDGQDGENGEDGEDDQGESGLCASMSINAQAMFLVTDPAAQCSLAVSANAYEVHVWDLVTAEMAGEPVPAGFVETAAVGVLDGRPAALVGARGPVEVWDLSAREHLCRPLTGHQDTVRGVVLPVLNERQLAVTGGDDRSVRIWDLDGAAETDSRPAGRAWSVRQFVMTVVDGRPVLVTAEADQSLRIRDLDDGELIGERLPGYDGSTSLLTVGTVEGRLTLLTRDADRTVRIWDLADREELSGRTTREYSIDSIHFFAVVEGRFVAVTWQGRVWDLTASRWIGVQPKQRGAYPLALETLEGRDVILARSETMGVVHLWDLITGEEAGPPLVGHTDVVRAAAAGMLDGRPVLATGGEDRTVRVWDASTRQQIGQYAFPAKIRELAAAPDGRLVVGFGSDIAVLAPC